MPTDSTQESVSRPFNRSHAKHVRRRNQRHNDLLSNWARGGRMESNEDLLRRYKAGDTSVRSEIVRLNIGLVRKMAMKKGLMGQMFDDLVSVGIVALMRSIDGFDPNYGTKFSTYACRAIRREIDEEVTNATTPVYVPHNIAESVYDMEWRGLDPKRIRDGGYYKCGTLNAWSNIEKARAAMQSRISTHEITTANGANVFSFDGDVPDTLTTNEEFHEIDKEDLRRFMLEGVARLDERSRKVVALRFGLNGVKPMTLKQIGEVLGITKERVRQIEEKALKRIRDGWPSVAPI